MKNVKARIAPLLGIIVMVAAIALAFATCGDGDVPSGWPGSTPHTHTYSTTWSYNATQHWHECTAGDGAKSGAANHTDDDPCTNCGYDSTATTVTFSGLTANGNATATTTTLTLTFSAVIPGLAANNITLSGVAGVQRGTLSGTGPTYTLGVSGFAAGGTLRAAVTKSGYNISGSPKSTTIYYNQTYGTQSNPKTMTAGSWYSDSVNNDTRQVWYSFYASSGSLYTIELVDTDGSRYGPLDQQMTAYYSSGSTIFSGVYHSQTFTASANGTVKIRVSTYYDYGPFRIRYTTSSGDSSQPFTDISEFSTWLYNQSKNTEANAYNVKINVSNLGSTSGSLRYALSYYENANKYVNLDLSGSTITYIDARAFEDCVYLISVTIPASVTSIGSNAFNGCSSLTSVPIPASVTSIGNSAFSYCRNLTSVTVDADNPNYASEGGILYNKDKTTLVAYPSATGSVTIPDSVTSIGNSAFYYCTATSVTIPDSVTSIGGSAFASCLSLASVTIGNSVTSIGNYAFEYCQQLTSITIPDSVTSIGGSAFSGCTRLTSVTFAGTIASGSFSSSSPFPGDLRDKFYADNLANGTAGTYTATGTGNNKVWTRQ